MGPVPNSNAQLYSCAGPADKCAVFTVTMYVSFSTTITLPS